MGSRITQSYESLAHIQWSTYLPEAFSGGDIAVWQGNIERTLQDMMAKAKDADNGTYARLLNKFLGKWTANKITGSLNIETLRALEDSADWACELPWDLKNFFSALRDRLRKLIATVGEELPMLPAAKPNEPGAAGGGPSKRFNPATGTVSDFGAEEGEGELDQPPEEAVGNVNKTADSVKNTVKKAVGMTARR
jgi:hypothetical protein